MIHRNTIALFALSAALSLSGCGGSDDSRAGTESRLQQRIEDYQRAQPLAPSVIARVERPAGALAWSGAVGVNERTTQAPARTETVFRIASITKTFVSAATHRLTE